MCIRDSLSGDGRGYHEDSLAGRTLRGGSLERGDAGEYREAAPVSYTHLDVYKRQMLHDFYLYDWHKPEEAQPLHGFRHPVTALGNARKHFKLNKVEENVILSHMWPLTLSRVPRCREAVLVCVADKICSLRETTAGIFRAIGSDNKKS